MEQKTKPNLGGLAVGAHSQQPRDGLVTDVLSRARDLQLVHLLDQNGREDADDDHVLVLGLRQGVVESIEIGGRNQIGSFQTGTGELISRPEARQIIVPD